LSTLIWKDMNRFIWKEKLINLKRLRTLILN